MRFMKTFIVGVIIGTLFNQIFLQWWGSFLTEMNYLINTLTKGGRHDRFE
jgi:hypothetical protein